jgi:hypothetical protein
MYSVLNCHNVAKHAEFYLGYLRFTGNARCLKKNFTMIFQVLVLRVLQNRLHLKAYKHLEQWIICTPVSVNVFVTPHSNIGIPLLSSFLEHTVYAEASVIQIKVKRFLLQVRVSAGFEAASIFIGSVIFC